MVDCLSVVPVLVVVVFYMVGSLFLDLHNDVTLVRIGVDDRK